VILTKETGRVSRGEESPVSGIISALPSVSARTAIVTMVTDMDNWVMLSRTLTLLLFCSNILDHGGKETLRQK